MQKVGTVLVLKKVYAFFALKPITILVNYYKKDVTEKIKMRLSDRRIGMKCGSQF